MSASPVSWIAQVDAPAGALDELAREAAALDLPEEASHALERLLGQGLPAPAQEPAVQRALVRVAYAAPFLLRYAVRRGPRIFDEVLAGLAQEAGLSPFAPETEPAALAGLDEAALLRLLRVWKYDNYLRLTARELLGLQDTATTCALLSDIADTLLRVAYRWAFTQQARRRGLPVCEETGAPVGGLVLAMGKLGGRELNYSSDVDLIFVHQAETRWAAVGPEDAPPLDPAQDAGAYWNAWAVLAAQAAAREPALSAQEFHNNVVRHAMSLVSQQTADGIGFRTDADLRPMGRGGQLSTPLGLMESYYDLHGRQWERTAMIKARAVDGPPGLWQQVQELVRPFVYRRYLDFAALEGIALIKHDINRHHGAGLDEDIKLGRGGIRENEFFVQALQLLYGGRNPALQVTGHAAAVERLGQAGVMEPDEGRQHLADYWLLRGLENRLQMVQEAQTQTLPPPGAERTRVLHDFAPDFPSRQPAAEGALAEARARIARRFDDLWQGMAGEELPDPETWRTVVRRHTGEDQHDALLARINELINQLMRTRAGERCVFKLTQLLMRPELYRQGTANAFPRWLEFMEQIGNRTTLYNLIEANPAIIGWVGLIFAEGGQHAQQLIRHPEFLESFLSLGDGRSGSAAIFDGVFRRSRDEEEFILELQITKAQLQLQVLTAYLNDVTSHAHWTQLADVADGTIAACTRFAWRATVARLGVPQGAPDEETVHGFSVLAMGKLGSREMRFGSDLDLVLLYREDGTTSTGHSNFEFYTKLGQKLSSLLTSPTQFGRLYELDQRLRPFGDRGLLVPSLGTYAKFLGEAEVWNFQALTRIRHVHGDAALSQELIGDIAAAWQRRAVPRGDVAGAVRTMLERLVAEHRGHTGPDAVSLKYAVGGMIGFEFLRQTEILLGMQQPGAGPPWTPPEQSEMIRALWPAYVDLVDLDECLALHLPRFDHVATMAQMETLAAVQARWRFADVAARVRELEVRVREGFAEVAG